MMVQGSRVDQQLADLAARHLDVVLVDQAHVEVAPRNADRSGTSLPGRSDQHGRAFGEPVGRGDRLDAEAALELVHLRDQRHHQQMPHRMPGIVLARRLLEQEVGHGAEQQGVRAAVAPYVVPVGRRGEARQHHAAAAGDQAVVHPRPLAADVKQRQRHERHVVGKGATEDGRRGIAVGMRVRHPHALGRAGRPRRVQDAHQVPGLHRHRLRGLARQVVPGDPLQPRRQEGARRIATNDHRLQALEPVDDFGQHRQVPGIDDDRFGARLFTTWTRIDPL